MLIKNAMIDGIKDTTIDDIKKSYLTDCFNQKPKDHDYISEIQKIINGKMTVDMETAAKLLGIDIAEEKCKIQKEMNNRVIETMEKDKFIDGKTTYFGTLNKCSMDFAAIKQVAGIDCGKENSKSFSMISKLMPDGSIETIPFAPSNKCKYCFETKPAPKLMYEVGYDKPFYENCAICNQCDQPNIYKPKTESYTCEKCFPR